MARVAQQLSASRWQRGKHPIALALLLLCSGCWVNDLAGDWRLVAFAAVMALVAAGVALGHRPSLGKGWMGSLYNCSTALVAVVVLLVFGGVAAYKVLPLLPGPESWWRSLLYGLLLEALALIVWRVAKAEASPDRFPPALLPLVLIALPVAGLLCILNSVALLFGLDIFAALRGTQSSFHP